MFKAHERPSYDKLQLNKRNEKPSARPNCARPLTKLAMVALNWHNRQLQYGISHLPVHLLPELLRTALLNDQASAVVTMVANWPFPTLRFADILNSQQLEVFEDELSSLCYYIVDGLASRTPMCRLTCLDLTDILLQASFVRQIIQMWPLLSLKKPQLKPKNLAKIVTRTAGLDEIKLSYEIIPKVLKERMGQDLMRFPRNRIKLPEGERLEVKLSDAHFTTSNLFFLDYMITNCLRDYTPLYVTVSNLHIKSDFCDGNLLTDSLAPFVVFKGQQSKLLDGLSLHQLEEGVFFLVLPDLQCFTHLRSLDISDCNIYLQEGVTRRRRSTRTLLCETFQCFTSLCRLNLSFNFLIGCLGEVLESLRMPLEYLSIRGCDVNDSDLVSLGESKHAASLRELNMSKLCHFSIYDNDRISPGNILKVVKNFPQMTLLNLAQNHLSDTNVKDFSCDTLIHMTRLKGLDISGNILALDSQVELARACAHVPSMQWLRLTCMNSTLNDAMFLHNLELGNMEDVGGKLRNEMKSLGRDDIVVDVVRLSFAILVDLVDFFD